MIADGYKANFKTIQRAAKNNDLALMECSDAITGKPVIALCAVEQDAQGGYTFKPLAKLFDGNPYEELLPPTVPDAPPTTH